jgi:hypothetical protein
MSFQIDIQNADRVLTRCVHAAVAMVEKDQPNRLITSIWFGNDFVIADLYGGDREAYDFKVERIGDPHVH